ncbi:unnamed protein product [Schistosoma turkestanicum]|nr:unnamed protein product [Schistosoma turkestanicum]
MLTNCHAIILEVKNEAIASVNNTTTPVSSSSSSSSLSTANLFESLNCTVNYHIELGKKPDNQHKENTQWKHSPHTPILNVGTYQWIELTCTCCCRQQYFDQLEQSDQNSSMEMNETRTTLLYKITSSNSHVIALSLSKRIHSNIHLHHCDNMSNHNTNTNTHNKHSNSICITLYLEIKCNQTNGFYIHAENLGHSQIITTLIWINSTSRKYIEKLTKSTDSLNNLNDDHDDDDDGDVDGDEARQYRSSGSSPLVTTNNDNSTTTTNTTITSFKQMIQHQKQLQEEILHQLTNSPINSIVHDLKQVKITDAKIYVQQQQQQQMDDYAQPPFDDHNDGVWRNYLWLTVLLRPQKFYMASDWSSAIITFMLALSTGCCNDPIMIKEELYELKAILIGLLSQLILIPMIAICIGLVFSLDIDQAFGLFICSTVPAGGLAYLMTYLSHGDRQLSAALSFIASIINLVIMPFWSITIGWYWFNRPINIEKTFGWLILLTSAQCLGTLMRGYRPGLARAILTWITRPLLLLSGILLITLGVYINHYAFNEVTQNLIYALLSLITSGFIVGWFAGLLTHQNCTRSRTLSTAMSVFNGLLCMPLLRTCVHAPEGDLAAVSALWIVLFAPIPLGYHAVVTIVQKWINSYLQNRRKQREQKEEENRMVTFIGGKQHEFGAASIAAVAAAAIAVTPTITTRNLLNTNTTTNNNDNHSTNQFEKIITVDNEMDSHCIEQSLPSSKSFVTNETAQKTQSTLAHSKDQHFNRQLIDEFNCENYDNYTRQYGEKDTVYNKEHFRQTNDDINLGKFTMKNTNSLLEDNKTRLSEFKRQQILNDNNTSWLIDSTNLRQQQQQEGEKINSTEIGMLTLTNQTDTTTHSQMLNYDKNHMDSIRTKLSSTTTDMTNELQKQTTTNQTNRNFSTKDSHYSIDNKLSPLYTNL